MKFSFVYQLLAAMWVVFVGVIVLTIPSWSIIPLVVNLSLPPLIIGRKLGMDAMARAMTRDDG